MGHAAAGAVPRPSAVARASLQHAVTVLLAQHPHAEHAPVAEWSQVLGGRTPTAADVPQPLYTTWVVREALRLYPPAWGLGREAVQDCTIGLIAL